MKIAVALNDRSGSAVCAEEIRIAFSAFGVACVIVPLDEQADERLMEAARTCDVLVAAGGDGTVSTVADALVRSGEDAVLGLLALGTANDLGRSLGVPADLGEGVEIIVEGRTVPMDVIRMDDERIFVNQANGGFGGGVAQQLEEDVKARWGPLGYWRASVDAAQELPEYAISLVVDGDLMEVSAMNVTVANARFGGGGVQLAPRAVLSDGKLDLVIMKSREKAGLLALIPRVLSATHEDLDDVISLQAQRVQFSATPEMPFSIDGEVTDEHPQLFEVLPGRLQVRAPR
ncbi:MAG: diacylglycerol kinase family lipid kinase [Chloroflexota bacterium]|nr:diacylglycerol kinase family lipid kinase [Chloroflexota bacterium]